MCVAVYVVFGASGGIGSALSKRLLAQPGATVVVAGRDEARLQQLVSNIGGGVPLVGDPCDPKQVSEHYSSWCHSQDVQWHLSCCTLAVLSLSAQKAV
jgi:NADP-dependent 3-hydroxy acid dehydrogenase YdfG